MNDVIGYIRVLPPRYVRKGQADDMAAHGVEKIVTEGKGGNGSREDLVRMVQQGTVVAIRHLFLLARPKGGRRDLWKAIDAIEARGGTLWEIYTGLRSDDRKQRDEMMRDAVEALAKGRHKRSAADKRGRPAKDFTSDEYKAAELAWRNVKKLPTWKDVEAALPEGFTVARAYKMWGSRF